MKGPLPDPLPCGGEGVSSAEREVDLNLLGAVESFPKLPTIEFRALPATLDAEAIFERLGVIDAFL
ncbi:MAG: hypothetical protein QM817_25060 [Archangium sp.]